MPDPKQQLEELLADQAYKRTLELLVREISSSWHLRRATARCTVLSAIGEPSALAAIYQAFIQARQGGKRGLPALISRRRVLDLLKRDARRAGHSSLPLLHDELEQITHHDRLSMSILDDPQHRLESRQLIQMMRDALACFASQGKIQERQADLLRSRHLEQRTYAELCLDLTCGMTALRVRVHAAKHALKRHILACHPELSWLLPSLSRVRGV